MNKSSNKIKWSALLPSMNIFRGKLSNSKVSLISMGSFYELRHNKSGKIQLKNIDKSYLSIGEKKKIIAQELLKQDLKQR